MAAGDHRLLNIHPVDEQLTDGPAITVGGDPTKADSPSFDHSAEMITGSPCALRLSSLPSQFWCVDAGQPDPLTGYESGFNETSASWRFDTYCTIKQS